MPRTFVAAIPIRIRGGYSTLRYTGRRARGRYRVTSPAHKEPVITDRPLPKLEVLTPTCNLQTIRDLRGGIFTWVPPDAIAEFDLVYSRPGKVRGNHYHPEFTEYFLVVSGEGVVVWKSAPEDPEQVVHMSRGMCVRIPSGVIHAFHAITDSVAVAMITKPWDECDPPLVRVDVIDPETG